MKKILFVMLGLILALPAMAKDKAQEKAKGFVFMPQEVIVESVEDVKNKADDTIVLMRGKIAKAMGDDKYVFSDKTGSIIIEIDSEDFDGMTVTQGEMLEISGEVDKDIMKPAEVEVKSIKKLPTKK